MSEQNPNLTAAALETSPVGFSSKHAAAVYSISRTNAVYLLSLLKGGRVPERTNAELKDLLGNVLKLAESISNNCKEWLEVTATIHADIHPYQAEKLNCPTLRGALSAAVTIPRVPISETCETCAFRVGSPANQTEAVAEDVLIALEDGGKAFFCHDYEGDKPTHPCRGYLEAIKIKKQNQPLCEREAEKRIQKLEGEL